MRWRNLGILVCLIVLQGCAGFDTRSVREKAAGLLNKQCGQSVPNRMAAASALYALTCPSPEDLTIPCNKVVLWCGEGGPIDPDPSWEKTGG